MFEYFDRLYESTDFMPHGDCLVWKPSLLWQHVGSDIATGIAYYLIAAVLFYFVIKRRDIPYFWVFILFGAFILSCGTTHLFAAWTIYYPSYWTEGAIKTVNAVISLGTAIVLVPLMPRLLKLPSLQNALDRVDELNKKLEKKVTSLEEEMQKRIQIEQELNLILNLAPGIICTAGTDGYFKSVNPIMEKILGFSKEEILSRPLMDFIHPDDKHPLKTESNIKIGGRRHRFFQNRYLCKDGSYRLLEWHTTSAVDGILYATATDITEQKQAEAEKKHLEEQLRQSHKMEAVGTMAGGIAHDFNNILAIILGNLGLVIDDLTPDNPMRSDLEEALKASHRAKDLVSQILTFSRKEQKELISVRPQALIKETLKLLRSTTPTTVSITQNISQDCGRIMADPTSLHQILMNIFTNAVHSMDEKGEVTVSLQEVNLGSDELDQLPAMAQFFSIKTPGTYARLSVTDSGTGMDEKTVERIFDPFYTTKEVGKGTGMGLSLVHGIVESHGGFIDVDSEPGRGSTFHVFFPVTEEEEEPVEAETTPLQTGTERILFIDDEESLLVLGKRILDKLGYEVTAENSSVKALEIFKSAPHQFDLIITDQAMPNMSGTELVAEIVKVRPDIPVILCTGYSSKVTRENAKEKGISRFITKPYTKKILAEAVRKVLNGKV